MNKKLSESMKKAHREGRHPGWSHINLKKNRRSYPEEFIFSVLKENDILNKYQVLEKVPVSKYFLDFAIIDLKLDIEVDGEQHYRTKEAIEHDKIRNEFLISKSWKIYRINWKEFNKNKKLGIKNLIGYIENIDNSTSVFYDISSVVLSKKAKHGSRKDYLLFKNIEYEKKQKIYIDKILKSNINFSKYKWVGEVSQIINQSPQKVNKWMKRFLPEFYENKCFKRNAPVSPLATNQLKG